MLNKRELAIYLELRRKFGYLPFNIGDALSHMRPYFSPKVVLSVLRYLIKSGLVSEIDNFTFKLNDLEDYLFIDVVYPYLLRKASLRRRSQR
ncbi:hypothetical protein GCM10007116_11530 [Sulfodiicoccus acidiphilus]|nr:hypothetical protein GCM10007116_11530 [Sulfodiicoccus acidiphilus]